MKKPLAGILMIAVSLSGVPAGAYDQPLAPGADVRAVTPTFEYEGRLIAIDGTSFVIDTGSDPKLSLSRSTVLRVEERATRRHTGMGSVAGLAAGVVIGLVAAAVSYVAVACPTDSSGACRPVSARTERSAERAFWGVWGGFTVGGAVIGSVVGSRHTTDRWIAVDPRRLPRLDVARVSSEGTVAQPPLSPEPRPPATVVTILPAETAPAVTAAPGPGLDLDIEVIQDRHGPWAASNLYVRVKIDDAVVKDVRMAFAFDPRQQARFVIPDIRPGSHRVLVAVSDTPNMTSDATVHGTKEITVVEGTTRVGVQVRFLGPDDWTIRFR